MNNILNRANWKWTRAGLEVTLDTSSGQSIVLIPIGHVELIFRRSLASVGCPMGASVGAPGTTHGFLASVGAAHSVYVGGRAERRARRARRRASGKRPFFKGKFFQGLGKAVKAVGNVAKKVVTNPLFRAGFAALATAVPMLAPAAAGLEIAARVIKKIDKGKEALRKLKSRTIGAADTGLLRQQVIEAQQALEGIEQMKVLALHGDRRAQQLLGDLVGAEALKAA